MQWQFLSRFIEGSRVLKAAIAHKLADPHLGLDDFAHDLSRLLANLSRMLEPLLLGFLLPSFTGHEEGPSPEQNDNGQDDYRQRLQAKGEVCPKFRLSHCVFHKTSA